MSTARHCCTTARAVAVVVAITAATLGLNTTAHGHHTKEAATPPADMASHQKK
jgi:hypothetical protein